MALSWEQEDIVKSKIKRCPKCGCTHLLLNEIWKDHTITFEQVDGSFNKKDGALEPGDPYKVEAKCWDCKYIWRVRKAIQITDIVKEGNQ